MKVVSIGDLNCIDLGRSLSNLTFTNEESSSLTGKGLTCYNPQPFENGVTNEWNASAPAKDQDQDQDVVDANGGEEEGWVV